MYKFTQKYICGQIVKIVLFKRVDNKAFFQMKILKCTKYFFFVKRIFIIAKKKTRLKNTVSQYFAIRALTICILNVEL